MARTRDTDACPGALQMHQAADGALARIRLPGGMISAGQLTALAEASAAFGSATLELTGRGNGQIRGITDTEAVAEAVAAAGLLPSATHERVRNIVASPLSGRVGGNAWPGVQVRVIPAMTAAQAVASRVGAPLGHDYAVISLSDRLKPWQVITDRLASAAAADMVLAIYNPASKSRTWQVAAMRDLLLEHREPGTPVVIGRDVSGPTERVTVVRLAELDPADIDMRCLLIVGSSQTQWYSDDSRDLVFTPRRYPS